MYFSNTQKIGAELFFQLEMEILSSHLDQTLDKC